MKHNARLAKLERVRPDDSEPLLIVLQEADPGERPSRVENVAKRRVTYRCFFHSDGEGGFIFDPPYPPSFELPRGAYKLVIGIPPEDLV